MHRSCLRLAWKFSGLCKTQSHTSNGLDQEWLSFFYKFLILQKACVSLSSWWKQDSRKDSRISKASKEHYLWYSINQTKPKATQFQRRTQSLPLLVGEDANSFFKNVSVGKIQRTGMIFLISSPQNVWKIAQITKYLAKTSESKCKII